MSALSRGFQIVETVTAASDDLGFSEIVAATGFPKASVHRLLKELVEISAITFDEATRTYHGGLLLAKLGAAVTEGYDIRHVVRPHLEALQEKTGYVATLGIRDDDVGIYLDKIEAKDFGIRLHSEIGKSFPLHCTAMGKVLLASADTATVNRISNRKLPSFTENTITDGRLLRKELGMVRDQGFAIDREEITRGLVCIAAPVAGADGTIAGALSCTVRDYALENDDIGELIGLVRGAASSASGADT